MSAFFRSLGSVLVILLITLGLLEIVLRVFSGIPVHRNPLSGFHASHPDLGWIGEPDYRGRFASLDFDVMIEHDHNGFRLPAEPVGDFESGATGIAFLGDSYTWGWGVQSGEVFTDILSADLGKVFRIGNFGINAYSTGQQRIMMDHYLQEFAPDVVIVMFFSNDLTENSDPKKQRRPWFELQDGLLVPRNQPVERQISGWWKNFARHSLAISTLRYNYHILTRASAPAPADENSPDNEQGDGGSPEYPESAWRLLEALLVDMRKTCSGMKPACELKLAYIPRRHEVKRFGVDGESVMAGRTRQLCMGLAIPFIDLTPGLYVSWQTADSPAPDVTPLYLQRDGHWDANGHRAVAGILADSWDR